MSLEINRITNLPDISYHAYKILIIPSSGSGKTYVLLTFIEINRQILKKKKFMSKIDLNHSINHLSKEQKKYELKHSK